MKKLLWSVLILLIMVVCSLLVSYTDYAMWTWPIIGIGILVSICIIEEKL